MGYKYTSIGVTKASNAVTKRYNAILKHWKEVKKLSKHKLFILTNNIYDYSSKEIKILPRGHVVSQKGEFDVDEESYKLMVNHFKNRGLDLVIDYEHQTLKDVEAPAGGWIKELKLKEDGIYAVVEWTKKASEYLANKEYRYLSPVVYVRKDDKKAVLLHSVALTNTPAIDGMKPIINSMGLDDFDIEGGNTMDLKLLISILGLNEDATEEDVKKAIEELAKKVKEGDIVANKELLDALDLKEDVSLEDAKAKVTALKDSTASPEGFVPMAMFEALANSVKKKETNDLIEMALKDGKLMPAQKEWAEQYALKDPEGFKGFIEKAPQIVPLGENKYVAKDGKVADDLQLSVNKQLNISAEDIEKYGKDED